MGSLLKVGVMLSLSVIGITQQSEAVQQDDQYEALLAKMKTCKMVPSQSKRVSCYDALVPQDLAVVSPPSSSRPDAATPSLVEPRLTGNKAEEKQQPVVSVDKATAVTVKPVGNDDRDTFGGEQLSRPAVQKVEKQPAKYRVGKITQNRNKLYFFYMENGQVWRQLERQRLYVPKGRSFDVEIVQGSFGDYRMRIEGKGRESRVKRIK